MHNCYNTSILSPVAEPALLTLQKPQNHKKTEPVKQCAQTGTMCVFGTASTKTYQACEIVLSHSHSKGSCCAIKSYSACEIFK